VNKRKRAIENLRKAEKDFLNSLRKVEGKMTPEVGDLIDATRLMADPACISPTQHDWRLNRFQQSLLALMEKRPGFGQEFLKWMEDQPDFSKGILAWIEEHRGAINRDGQ
jgi:hypothetical protein